MLTFLAGSFRQSRDLIQRVLLSLSRCTSRASTSTTSSRFLALEPRIRRRPGGAAGAGADPDRLVFESVGFRYPGSDRWAVRGLDFSLAPGERLALVGENGAGKTTLVKLLARLYDPSEGRILLDGVDLREYDVESLRRNVGVIFQDFVRYDFVLRENIASATSSAEDEPGSSAPPSGAWPTRWPPGWAADTTQMLGRRFEGGVELSGGEWQKVALARAYMRDAQLLILDEPTAALDARAEYEVFLRFSELTRGGWRC